MRRLAVLVVLAALAGCGSSPKTTASSKPAPPPPIAPWVLTTLDGQGGEPAYLSNGLIGLRVGRSGGGLAPDGKPLGFFMIDEYEPKGEEKIRTMPNPIMVTWAVGNTLYDGKERNYDFIKSGGTPLDPRGGTDYKQALDMRTGVLTTEWKQEGVDIRCETILHPTERALGQRWTLKPTKDTTFSIRTLDYSGPNDDQKAMGGDQDAGIAVTASHRRIVTMGWRQNGGVGNANVEVGGFRIQEGSAKAGEAVTFDRTLSFGLPAAKPLPIEDLEKNAGVLEKATPRPYGYDEILTAAKAAWKKRWTSDIEIDGPVEDQQAIHSFLFYLRSSIAKDARRAIAPMALSSDIYNGHVFWDADIWVLPALMLTDPDLAKEIGDYRLDRVGQAASNFQDWVKNERPIANGKLGFVTLNGVLMGAKYPWESSVTGKETVPGPSQFEDHITGSVLWGLTQLESVGIKPAGTDLQARAIMPGILALEASSFYNLRSQAGPAGREIKNVVSPDENHTGDNDLYTNLLAMWTTASRTWPDKQTYKLPKDGKSFLTYDNDLGKGYKQAAALLACYPLQYPPAEAQTKTMLERFVPNTIANGPAMTDSIHGLLYARIGDPQKGYDEWRKGWVDFTRHPLLMFSEKRKAARTYFATGAGGSLQTVLFGFAGLRLDYKKAADAVWSHPLAGGKMLSVKPSLPPSWKRVRLRGISLPDGRYDFVIEPGKVSAVKEAQR